MARRCGASWPNSLPHCARRSADFDHVDVPAPAKLRAARRRAASRRSETAPEQIAPGPGSAARIGIVWWNAARAASAPAQAAGRRASAKPPLGPLAGSRRLMAAARPERCLAATTTRARRSRPAWRARRADRRDARRCGGGRSRCRRRNGGPSTKVCSATAQTRDARSHSRSIMSNRSIMNWANSSAVWPLFRMAGESLIAAGWVRRAADPRASRAGRVGRRRATAG